MATFTGEMSKIIIYNDEEATTRFNNNYIYVYIVTWMDDTKPCNSSRFYVTTTTNDLHSKLVLLNTSYSKKKIIIVRCLITQPTLFIDWLIDWLINRLIERENLIGCKKRNAQCWRDSFYLCLLKTKKLKRTCNTKKKIEQIKSHATIASAKTEHCLQKQLCHLDDYVTDLYIQPLYLTKVFFLFNF